MLKKFKGKEGFIENVGLSRFKIYIITLHNLRNNFRLRWFVVVMKDDFYRRTV